MKVEVNIFIREMYCLKRTLLQRYLRFCHGHSGYLKQQQQQCRSMQINADQCSQTLRNHEREIVDV